MPLITAIQIRSQVCYLFGVYCPRCRCPAKKLFQLPFGQGRKERAQLRQRGQVECDSCKTVLQAHVSVVYQLTLGVVGVGVLVGYSVGVAIPLMTALAIGGSWVEAKTTRYELLLANRLHCQALEFWGLVPGRPKTAGKSWGFHGVVMPLPQSLSTSNRWHAISKWL